MFTKAHMEKLYKNSSTIHGNFAKILYEKPDLHALVIQYMISSEFSSEQPGL